MSDTIEATLAELRRSALLLMRRPGAFDEAGYREQLGPAADAVGDVVGHYYDVGSATGLRPTPLFDPAFYRLRYPAVAAAGFEPYHHWLQTGRSEGRETCFGPRTLELQMRSGELNVPLMLRLMADDPAFDPTFYRAQVPHLAADASPLEHYLSHGWRDHLDPAPGFDAVFYTSRQPEVRGFRASPLLHYVALGRGEGAPTTGGEDFDWVPDGPARVDDDVEIERLRGLAFFARHGFAWDGPSPLDHAPAAAAEIAARGLRVPPRPEVSIVVPVYGQLPYVLGCLHSLSRHVTRHAFEVVVVDDCSPAADRTELLSAVTGIRLVRTPENLGFIGACRLGAAQAEGELVVFLNSDTRVCRGWLDELVDTFARRPAAGLVGSKLINEDGTLQEAGGIVWRDGSAWNHGRNDDPNKSQYCFPRRVDYCSGAAIAVRRDLWEALGGFDDHYAPAYYEDVDFAFRIREAGRQVWYQSLARVLHYEGKTHGRDTGAGVKAYQTANARKFAERWREALSEHREPGLFPDLEANRTVSLRMLAVDAVTPKPDRDAGSVMTARLLQIYARMGWQVTFVALYDVRHDRKYSTLLQREGIETVSYPSLTATNEVSEFRPGVFDAVLGFRVGAFAPIFDRQRELQPAADMLFHVIDLHHLRLRREAELTGDRRLRREAEIVQDQELDLVLKADCTLVPSHLEKTLLEEGAGVANVVVYPYTEEVRPSSVGRLERPHLVFVGGFGHPPNADAVGFFLDEVWPTLLECLPPEAKLYVVGSDPPERLLRRASDRVVFTGFVESLADVLDRCRLSVAPLRFGAGLKGKVVSSLAHGLPCVASSIAVEGMGLAAGTHFLLADEARQTIDAVLRLYDDAALWEALQSEGLRFVESTFSWSAGEAVARQALEVADRAWTERRRRARSARLAAERPTPGLAVGDRA